MSSVKIEFISDRLANAFVDIFDYKINLLKMEKRCNPYQKLFTRRVFAKLRENCVPYWCTILKI